MNEAQLKELRIAIDSTIDKAFAEKLTPLMGDIATEKAKSIIESMKLDRHVFGKDISGLTEKQKKDFVKVAQAVAGKFALDTKANEALIEEQDNRGGYLVSKEVASAIMRIAASVGTVMSQAMKWPMKTDELGIPNYTGSFLTGAYLGVDVAGTVTGLTFGQAALIAKKWQLAFVVGNDLLADASANLADWLLAIGGEALANMIDQQGLVGGTTAYPGPFLGVLGITPGTGGNNTIDYQCGSGKTKFSNTNATTPDGFDVLVDGSNMIGQLEESVLEGAGFYCHRTVWAALRVQKDSGGNFILPFAGIAGNILTNLPGGGPIRPAGEILGYPVYTNRWMPTLPTANAASANTYLIIFGNLKSMAFGDKGEMRVSQFESGAFGGKEVALADQRGIVYKHRHALVVVLPQAFVVGRTASA